MKILNIGDLHLGVKKDDDWIQAIQRDGFRQMIDYSVANGITTWIQYGDTFDVRAHTTQRCMEFTREMFDLVEAAGITVHTILGNHDLFYKTTLYPNTVQELLSHRKNVIIYDKPTTVDFDGCLIDLIPWMCEENTGEILEHIKTSSAAYCVGHWELNGFYFYKGMKSHGLEPDFLKTYKQVWSGHFHTISEAANVKYIGTPWTLTAGDENDPRGFWVFDTDVERMEFIPNETTWHRRITYPFKGKINYSDYTNLAVRVIVSEIDSELTKFESELEKVVHSLRMVSKVDNSVESDDDQEIEIKSLQDIIKEYIDAIPDISDEDREALVKYSNELYIEATQ
ncbi:recombination-related endonuclease [Escherichia phage AV109]|nr:recombination-related endonuclease [Escherichia phage AV109]WPK35067.1 recombination-related endonuclease [Escherichia phage AV114]WPK35328.1 recombination-related endonuclease [Escherichia phage AV115]WPK35583.1 recombination-related endonuclease [Escherichia phage AV116]WPK36113.1 recombination-related endonuclease [Escherichia phage AV118]